jgi:hypothetical protein
LQAFVARKSAEAQKEIERLADESRLDEQERIARSAGIQQELSAWDVLSQEIQKVVSGLEVLDQAMALLSENER